MTAVAIASAVLPTDVDPTAQWVVPANKNAIAGSAGMIDELVLHDGDAHE